MNLYTKDGWINYDIIKADKTPFILMLGGRGIGKTYAVLKDIVETDKRFLYMRRKKDTIDKLKLPMLNPFNELNNDTGKPIIIDSFGNGLAGFYHAELIDEVLKPVGEQVGIAVSLASFATLRGISGALFDLVVYDEAIPEKAERPFKGEEEAFLNAVESLNRNRELTGKSPLKFLILSNSNDLNAPILRALNCVGDLDKMIRTGKNHVVIHDGALSIYRYLDSPISAKKKQTALYKIANNEEFEAMALSNKFSPSNYENVEPRPLAEFNPLVSIGGITVYEHKSRPEYYVIPGHKAREVYTTYKQSLVSFRRNYFYLKTAYFSRIVYFSTAPAKIEFERVLDV